MFKETVPKQESKMTLSSSGSVEKIFQQDRNFLRPI